MGIDRAASGMESDGKTIQHARLELVSPAPVLASQKKTVTTGNAEKQEESDEIFIAPLATIQLVC